MLTTDLLVTVIITSIVFGGFSSFIASQKNRNGFSWFILGCLFWLLAILALIAIPPLEKSKPQENNKPEPDMGPDYVRATKYSEDNGISLDTVKASIIKGSIDGKYAEGQYWVRVKVETR